MLWRACACRVWIGSGGIPRLHPLSCQKCEDPYLG